MAAADGDTLVQLRVGAVRDGALLWRAWARPTRAITAGRSSDAVLPIDDPSAPELHPLFRLAPGSCLLEFRREWDLVLFRDDREVPASALVDEGTAFMRGRRLLLRIAPGSRGAVRFGATRLLFRFEALPEEEVGDVPLRDVGDVPRCRACGSTLHDALPREGLMARCGVCRAVSRFADPDAAYRPEVIAEPELDDITTAPHRFPDARGVIEEAQTLIAMPIFAPVSGAWSVPVALPAGAPAPPPPTSTPDPLTAIEGLRTVLATSPWLGPRRRGRERKPPPSADPPTPVALPLPAYDVPSHPEIRLDPRGGGRFLAIPSLKPEDADAVDTSLTGAREPAGAPPPGLWKTADVRELGKEGPTRKVSSIQRPRSGIDDAFYTAELEALPVGSLYVGHDPTEVSVPWATHSVLSARSEFSDADGRVRHPLGPEFDEADRSVAGWIVVALLFAVGLAALAATLHLS